MKNTFNILASDRFARSGVLKTSHGKIKTPFFMPVATKGSVKLVSNSELEEMKTQCLISNAYVLSLRPGLDVIEKAGGLHKFMDWKNSVFTDSGGFQILRPEFFRKIDNEKVSFRNPFDQSNDFLSPEKSIEIQNRLGSDVAMCLDDVPMFGSPVSRLKESANRTFEWAKRCLKSHRNKRQLLFGICQGGTNPILRKKSAEQLASLDFDGFALGGLGIGEPKAVEAKMIAIDNRVLPENKPRYLMGVGTPGELVRAIELGVDVFDSAFPTQTGRHGLAFSGAGRINISSAVHKFDSKPLDSDCACFVCQSHSRSFLHHLFRTGEENSMRFLSYHNLFFLQSLLAEVREAIGQNDFKSIRKKYSVSSNQ